MSISILDPVLQAHLDPELLKRLEEHLPDYNDLHDPLLKRYKMQIKRGVKLLNAIQRENAHSEVKYNLRFVLDDDIIAYRLTRLVRPYAADIHISILEDDVKDKHYTVRTNLGFMEWMNDKEVKAWMAHELGHVPLLEKTIASANRLIVLATEKYKSITQSSLQEMGISQEEAKMLIMARLKGQIAELVQTELPETREREFHCDDFAGTFIQDRFAIISALEKMYVYNIRKFEFENSRTNMTPAIREKFEREYELFKTPAQDPTRHPGEWERIVRQKNAIKLLGPGKS